jgi:hypothetical protein
LAEATIETPAAKEDADNKTTWFDATGLLPFTQLALEVSKQLTPSPFAGVQVKVGVVDGAPELIPLICHWYKGAGPPFTGRAIKLTGVPWQNGFAPADIVTEAGKPGLTAMLKGTDVAGLPLTQAALEVSLQVTASPFAGV